MSDTRKIQSLIDSTIIELKEIDTQDGWSKSKGWVSYFLESLDDEFGVDSLREVVDMIIRRLMMSGW